MDDHAFPTHRRGTQPAAAAKNPKTKCSSTVTFSTNFGRIRHVRNAVQVRLNGCKQLTERALWYLLTLGGDRLWNIHMMGTQVARVPSGSPSWEVKQHPNTSSTREGMFVPSEREPFETLLRSSSGAPVFQTKNYDASSVEPTYSRSHRQFITNGKQPIRRAHFLFGSFQRSQLSLTTGVRIKLDGCPLVSPTIDDHMKSGTRVFLQRRECFASLTLVWNSSRKPHCVHGDKKYLSSD